MHCRHDFRNVESLTLLAQLGNASVLHLAKTGHAKSCVGISQEIGCEEVQLDLKPLASFHPKFLALKQPLSDGFANVAVDAKRRRIAMVVWL